ncbi:unnamed protein product, partial [marine sediment metagenome]
GSGGLNAKQSVAQAQQLHLFAMCELETKGAPYSVVVPLPDRPALQPDAG